MWVGKLELKNVRSFIDVQMLFSKRLNVIVGANNAGKSTIIKSLALMQYNGLLNSHDIRKGNHGKSSSIVAEVNDAKDYLSNLPAGNDIFESALQPGGKFRHSQITQLHPNEPQNFIYPYFSHRKVSSFQEDIRESNAINVAPNLSNLSAKLSMVTSHGHPQFQIYKDTCESLLGFFVGNIPSANGQVPGIYISNSERIPLSSMGDGVAHMVGFIVNLVIAENKLFLIEEPENDVHPTALKRLLNLIIESSKKNQFIISTHSNIVVKTIGSIADAKVLSLNSSVTGSAHTTTVQSIQLAEERRIVLEELGYDFYDTDSFNGWIFFEESSAERIVRDFLIPWFAPKINGKVKTFSCKSASKVKKRFDEFNSLFSFLNLEPKYKDRAWVLIDNGESEKNVLDSLKTTYVQDNNWKNEQFLQLQKHDFECYYPKKFENDVQAALNEQNGDRKRVLKKHLLEKVLDWAQKNQEEAKIEFSESAKEVIEILCKIEASIVD